MQSQGIGFGEMLGIVFIVLKLCGVVKWSWLWVLAPIWIPIALALAVIIIALLVVLFVPGTAESKLEKLRRFKSSLKS
jgi:hypothetical protein